MRLDLTAWAWHLAVDASLLGSYMKFDLSGDTLSFATIRAADTGTHLTESCVEALCADDLKLPQVRIAVLLSPDAPGRQVLCLWLGFKDASSRGAYKARTDGQRIRGQKVLVQDSFRDIEVRKCAACGKIVVSSTFRSIHPNLFAQTSAVHTPRLSLPIYLGEDGLLTVHLPVSVNVRQIPVPRAL
ncbi:hypothetical protein GGR56DRAFT_655596 [Xylariaceae sp. FL0804]|nr:hypothetical protein GGR56DRAFT_655596 [Xylariaceae sp. FL0804]